jgi:hypothetical protein
MFDPDQQSFACDYGQTRNSPASNRWSTQSEDLVAATRSYLRPISYRKKVCLYVELDVYCYAEIIVEFARVLHTETTDRYRVVIDLRLQRASSLPSTDLLHHDLLIL